MNSKIDIAGAVSINGDVEAGKSKSTMDPGTSKSKLNQNLKNMKGSFNSCGKCRQLAFLAASNN